MNKLVYLLLCTLFSLTGCYYDIEAELYPVDPACETTALSYTGNIKQIVDANCAVSGCHVEGTGRANLTTYAGLKQIADNGLIHQKVVVEQSMPPSGPLPDCEMRQIEAWLSAGASQNQ